MKAWLSYRLVHCKLLWKPDKGYVSNEYFQGPFRPRWKLISRLLEALQ